MTSKTISTRALLAGATIALACAGVSAQNTTTDARPAGVGVAPSTAAAAQEKAVPRADTGTVVRTGPTAVERAKQASSSVKEAATPDRDAKDSTTAGSASGSGISRAEMPSASDRANNRSTDRPAKADRN